jgi:hypothetical protein
MDPVGSLIGTILLASGLVLLWGAIKNRKVFGATGMVTTALTTGSIRQLEEVPIAYEQNGPAEVTAIWQIPIATQKAIANIATTDANLAAQINEEVRRADSHSDRAGLMALAQLLALADAKGHRADTAVIRVYIKGLSGESV